VIGPKASGKSTIAKNLATRTNMEHIDFDLWTEENGLEE
jgi:shikimate kinase